MTGADGFHSTVFTSGRRVTVSVVGEIDFATLPRFRVSLGAALECGAEVIEVDFTGVSFCDCSGVNGLLWAWQRACADGTAFRVVGVVSPVVLRVFHLLGIEHLLALRPTA